MLIPLEAAVGDQAAIERARDILKREIDHPMKITLLVSGDSPAITRFAGDAGMTADRPWRVVVWAKSNGILDAAQLADLRGVDNANVAVLYGFDDHVVERFHADATIGEIDGAFGEAERV